MPPTPEFCVGDTNMLVSWNQRNPTQNLQFAFYPTRNPNASQWNIGCVGSQRKMLALAMYISCFLCIFHLRLVPKANPISSGIWAIVFSILLQTSYFSFLCINDSVQTQVAFSNSLCFPFILCPTANVPCANLRDL